MEWAVTLHSYWRWIVLIAGIVAVVLGILAFTGTRPWDAVSARAALIFTIVLDIQVLIGLLVWVSEQRWSGDAYLGYLHPLLMIGAVAIAHVGRSRTDRVADSQTKGRMATFFFVASFIVILVAIPLGSWPV